MPSRQLGPGLLCAVIALAASVASGQTMAQMATVRQACLPSAQRLCPIPLAARDRDGVKACLLKNLDQVSAPCAAALKAIQAAQK